MALYAPWPHQVEARDWLRGQVPGGILASEMGTGKTGSILLVPPPGAPIGILVASSATGCGVWPDETLKFRDDFKARFAPRGRLQRWPQPGELIACTFGQLPLDVAALGPVPEYSLFVIDEAHRCGGHRSQRLGLLGRIAEAFAATHGRIYPTTASPMRNNPGEVWTLLRLCGRAGKWETSYDRWCRAVGGDRYLLPPAQRRGKELYAWRFNGEVQQEARELLQSAMMRQLKSDVAPNLPPKRWMTLRVPLPAKFPRTLLDRVLGDCEGLLELADLGDEEACQALARLEKKAESELAAARRELAEVKLEYAIEIAEDCEAAKEPLLVFSMHREPVIKLGKRERWGCIVGGMYDAAEQRKAIADKFQRGELDGIAATIQSGGESLTLTRARRVLFIDRSFVPSDNEQAENRAHRIGSDLFHGPDDPIEYCTLEADHELDRRCNATNRRKVRAIQPLLDAITVSKAPERAPWEQA